MIGYYFHNMDIRSTRAHACQILNTTVSVSGEISLHLVLPKYSEEVDFEAVKITHCLPKVPTVVFLRNFGIHQLGITAFTLFNIPAALFLIQKKLKGEVDYLYFRSSYFAPLAVVASILRVPFIYETHRKPISRSELFRDYFMSKLAAGIVVISAYMKEHYVPYKKEILVVHDAVSLERFASGISKEEARKKLGLAANDKVCVYTGTVSKLKGMDTVIATARMLPNVHFLLAGHLLSEFTKDDFPSNVRLFGRLEQKELPDILQTADVLILPHPKGEYSQSPMKLFEYMATKVPIVSSKLPSLEEVLNEHNAILVEADDASALAHGIEKATRDTALSRVLAEKAYGDVQQYTWEKRGIAIASFTKKII